MATVHVRYMVDDVEGAIAFYMTHLGLTLLSSALPAFADVTRGDLRLDHEPSDHLSRLLDTRRSDWG